MPDIATDGLTHALEAERRIEPGGNLRASWEALMKDARDCTRCDLYKFATQTVFGEGPLDASIMFVGEQPGDQEDIAGRPFVGPAGAVFDAALEKRGSIARRSASPMPSSTSSSSKRARGGFTTSLAPEKSKRVAGGSRTNAN